jgi:hypothetical protein
MKSAPREGSYLRATMSPCGIVPDTGNGSFSLGRPVFSTDCVNRCIERHLLRWYSPRPCPKKGTARRGYGISDTFPGDAIVKAKIGAALEGLSVKAYIIKLVERTLASLRAIVFTYAESPTS